MLYANLANDGSPFIVLPNIPLQCPLSFIQLETSKSIVQTTFSIVTGMHLYSVFYVGLRELNLLVKVFVSLVFFYYHQSMSHFDPNHINHSKKTIKHKLKVPWKLGLSSWKTKISFICHKIILHILSTSHRL